MKVKTIFFGAFFALITFAFSPSIVTAQETSDTVTAIEETPGDVPVSIDTVTPPATETPGGFKDKITVENLVNWWTLLAAGLMTLLTYVSGFFPKFVFIKDDRKRDLALKAIAAAILVGVTLVVLGPASGFQMVAAFIMAVVGYDKVLNPVGLKTKTAAEPKQ